MHYKRSLIGAVFLAYLLIIVSSYRFVIVRKKKFVNLSIMTIKFPITAIASILHRISGVFLFFCIGFILYAFEMSLSSEDKFYELTIILEKPFSRFIVWFFLSSLLYHCIAGIKHLFMDLGFFEDIKSGSLLSLMTILLSFSLIAILGARLW